MTATEAERQQSTIELGNDFQTGMSLFEAAEWDAAEKQFRKVILCIKWRPHISVEEYRVRANEMLDRIAQARRCTESNTKSKKED